MNNLRLIILSIRGLSLAGTSPGSAPKRLNREYPAKEKKGEGTERGEENQENVSQKPKVVLRKRECHCLS